MNEAVLPQGVRDIDLFSGFSSCHVAIPCIKLSCRIPLPSSASVKLRWTKCDAFSTYNFIHEKSYYNLDLLSVCLVVCLSGISSVSF